MCPFHFESVFTRLMLMCFLQNIWLLTFLYLTKVIQRCPKISLFPAIFYAVSRIWSVLWNFIQKVDQKVGLKRTKSGFFFLDKSWRLKSAVPWSTFWKLQYSKIAWTRVLISRLPTLSAFWLAVAPSQQGGSVLIGAHSRADSCVLILHWDFQKVDWYCWF